MKLRVDFASRSLSPVFVHSASDKRPYVRHGPAEAAPGLAAQDHDVGRYAVLSETARFFPLIVHRSPFSSMARRPKSGRRGRVIGRSAG